MKVGDKIKDNDPRMKHRGPLRVVEVREFSVSATDSQGFTFNILRRRIYSDGKSRRNGFDLLP